MVTFCTTKRLTFYNELMRQRLLKLIPLFFITVIAFCLRVYSITKVPPSLNWDEISHGYNAYSILKTGKDEWGMKFPLIFRAFGDYKLPLYIYLTTIPIFLLGLTPFSVRLVSVLAGTLAIPGIYLLTNQWFSDFSKVKLKPKKEVFIPGLIAAFLLALNPWHFFISRPALEANLGLTLFIYGLYFLLRSKDNSKFFLYASVFLSLTLHAYNSYRVLTPLVVLAFMVIYCLQWSSHFKNKLGSLFRVDKDRFLPIFSTSIFLISFTLVLFQFISGTGTARYSKLAILSPNAVYQIGEKRTTSSLPPFISKVLYNRPTYFVTTFAKNYLSYFSPAFLYQTWGPQYQFAIPGKNLLTLPVYLLSILGVIVSMITFVSKKRTKPAITSTIYLLLLLILSPISAALTADPPQSLRPTPMIIPLLILATLGLMNAIDLVIAKLKNKFVTIGIVVYVLALISFSFGRYLYAYFDIYPNQYSSSWQYGYQEAFEYLNEHSSEYQRIFVTKALGEPHIFYAFYTKLDPNLLQPGNDNVRYQKSDWFWTDRVGKVYFINDWQIPNNKNVDVLPLETGAQIPVKNSLIITTFESLPLNAKIIKFIRRPDFRFALVIAKFD